MENKKIYILQTRFRDNGSKIIGLITGSYYIHCSIGFGEDMNTFYSFVTKGFRTEKISRYVKPDKEAFPCQMYELDVTDEVYERMKTIVNCFVESKDVLKYSNIGVVMTLLHIPYKRKNHFFCSQFVAHVLGQGQAVKLQKASHMYLPRDFEKIPGIKLKFQGNLRTLMEQFQIAPCVA